MSIMMGLPEELTWWERRSISEKADCRPYWDPLGYWHDWEVCGLRYPLRLKLLPSLCAGDRVLEGGVVFPELELLEGGSAGEEVEDAADDGLLVVVELDAWGSLNVRVFDLVVFP